MKVIINIFVTIVVVWLLYVSLVFRISHPEVTETQLSLKFFSFGLYDPLKKKGE